MENYIRAKPEPWVWPSWKFMCFILSVVIVVAIGTTTMILWLVNLPDTPTFTLTSLQVSLSPDNLTVTSNANLDAYNHNPDLVVHYNDKTEANIFYKDSLLAHTLLPPFDQPKKSHTSINATIIAAFSSSSVVGRNEFYSDVITKSIRTFKFDLRLLSYVRFERRRWNHWPNTVKHRLRVDCDDLVVTFDGSTGTLSNGGKRCSTAFKLWT